MKDLGLDWEAREVSVPIDRNSNNLDKHGCEKISEEEEKVLKEDGGARVYRALAARLKHLGQEELSRNMSCPNEDDMVN